MDSLGEILSAYTRRPHVNQWKVTTSAPLLQVVPKPPMIPQPIWTPKTVYKIIKGKPPRKRKTT